MPRAFFQDGAFFAPGAFFEEGVPVTPPGPVSFDLGVPGDAVHALPFRGRGGSVLDLDLLYGLLGDAASLDVVPLFVLGTRAGAYRLFSTEIPRPVILDEVIEAHATLLEVEDFTVEGNPTSNMLGSIGLSTRPMSSVTLDNSDGYWTDLDERELLLGSPAALYWDLAHQVIMRELSGEVSAVVIEGTTARLTFGHIARETRPALVTD